MSKKLTIAPKQPLAEGQKWNATTGHLKLDKADKFTVIMTVEESFYKNPKHPKPQPFKKLSPEEYKKMIYLKRISYDCELKIYEERQLYYEHSIQKISERVCWCWEKVGKGMKGRKISHNNSFKNGLPFDLCQTINFPKLLEGGAPAWLEVFAPNDPVTTQVPYGMFVSATGTPKIIAAEWRDHTGKLITKEIAFRSTVYLHVYTEALYGQNIDIQLADDGIFTDTNLTPTPSDKDGDPVQKLDPKALTIFRRPVDAHNCNEVTQPPAGAITNRMIYTKGDKQLSAATVQKCVFPVFIEPAWQFQAKGDFNSGKTLEIKPIVHHPKIEKQKKDLHTCILKITPKGVLINEELNGNNPLLLNQDKEGGAPENQKKIDFTFGIFIDGTLNNMYNSIARQTWEDDQIQKKHDTLSAQEQQWYKDNPEERLTVAASSQKQIGKADESKYKFKKENSYENDLSNPAIIYKNYSIDPTNKSHPVFKIYTEGMGTNTLNDDDELADTGILPLKNYEKDDVAEGPGFGQGKAGIIDRVERAVKLMADKIIATGENEVGTITVDVFGFSRGAASARCFVHEITRQAYRATGTNFKGKRYFKDANGHEVSSAYSDKKLPSNGRLGYYLTEAKTPITFDRLVIRFAGLYDTVPHHGFVQWNDVKDLGLNSITKAKYTVHMVAADEHRANFDLVDISCITGKKGGGKTARGIELYLPGVHCDVGGSYVEGRSEVNGRLLVSPSMWGLELEKEQERLIAQGWFKPKGELTIHWDNAQRTIINGVARLLSSNREAISNQYSYIPLHLMVKFCVSKEIVIKEAKLKEMYYFRNTKFSNAPFLEKIKTRLEQYAFQDGEPFVYETVTARTIVYSTDDLTAVLKEEERRKTEEKQLNADIRQLRHDYLHWNAVYGEGMVDTLVQANKPNFENGERKRNVNG